MWLKLLTLLFFLQILAVCQADKIVGKRNGGRIIGGADAFAGQFPFAAAITVQTTNGRYFCGGALLNHDWVITSGLCAYDGILFTIQLGSNTLLKDDPNRLTLTSNDYIIHPDFDPESLQNDIGLIKLREPVPYSIYVLPINLPSVNMSNNTIVTAVGWGQVSDFDDELSEILQHVNVFVLPNAQCEVVYGNAITSEMACVEGNYNEGTCVGDTGSPLVEYLSRQYWIVGIASFISGNGCESTDPSGYTRTFSYQEWIRSIAY